MTYYYRNVGDIVRKVPILNGTIEWMAPDEIFGVEKEMNEWWAEKVNQKAAHTLFSNEVKEEKIEEVKKTKKEINKNDSSNKLE